MQSLGRYQRQRSLMLILMVVLLVVVGLFTQMASASYRACRADPIVWLSNGEKVQMMAQIGADANDVDRITYTLHAPVGTTVERIVYTGGPLSDKEEVVFIADLLPDHYTSDTVVTTRGNGINVTATTAMGSRRDSASGLNSEHLIINFWPTE